MRSHSRNEGREAQRARSASGLDSTGWLRTGRDVVASAESPRGTDIGTTSTRARRRLIAVGKKQNGRWQVRTSLWRYLASTAISQ